MKFSVRLALVLGTILFLFPFFKVNTFAQISNTPTPAVQNYTTPDTNSNVPKNMHTLTQSLVIEILSSFVCQLGGIDPMNKNQECLGVDPNTGKIGFVKNGGGLVGVAQKMIVSTYSLPIHTGDYIAYVGRNFGITKPTYAADPNSSLGLQSLSPLINLWVAFRNIVYLLFVVIFTVIGLAIMLRVRIDPRTVMTIQNQIPKLIIGIVLVTFSFALSGFLVDLMYVSSYLGIGVVASADKSGNISPNIGVQLMTATNPIHAADIATMGGKYDGNNPAKSSNDLGLQTGLIGIAVLPANAAGHFLGPLFANPVGSLLMAFVMGVLGHTAGQSIGTIVGALLGAGVAILGILGAPVTGGASLIVTGALVGGTLGAAMGTTVGGIWGATDPASAAGGFISIIAYLIILIAILYSLYKLWFQLIIAYISIFIDVIFSPFWIAAGLIPGSKIGFGSWLRDIISNLSVFPITLLMFLLSKVIIDAMGPCQGGTVAGFACTNPQNFFVAPLIGNPSFPNEIVAIIGLGFILSTPEVVKIVKTALKAPQTPLGGPASAIGFAAKIPAAFGKGTWGSIMKRDQYGRPLGGGAFLWDEGKGMIRRGAVRVVPGYRTVENIRQRIEDRNANRGAARVAPAAGGGTPPPPPPAAGGAAPAGAGWRQEGRQRADRIINRMTPRVNNPFRRRP